MSSNERNQNRTDATEDDDFGDFEGPEDDAPECAQAMGGPPTWVFPDLLRVQTNQTAHEEPESRTNFGTSSSQPRPHVVPRANDMRGATGRETGAIPKRVLDPPDVSLLTNTSQSKLPSTLDLCSTAFSSNSYSRDNSPIALSSQPSTSSVVRPSHLLSESNGALDCNQKRINQMESELKSLQTQKQLLQQQLLQKDTQIRELQSHSRQSSLTSSVTPTQSQESMIAALLESVDKFRTNIESAVTRLEQRLTSLETKVSETNLSFCDSNAANDNSNDSQNSCHNLSALLAQQKREIESEKRQNLLLFSSILKSALETMENHLDVSRQNCDQK